METQSLRQKVTQLKIEKAALKVKGKLFEQMQATSDQISLTLENARLYGKLDDITMLAVQRLQQQMRKVI